MNQIALPFAWPVETAKGCLLRVQPRRFDHLTRWSLCRDGALFPPSQSGRSLPAEIFVRRRGRLFTMP